MTTTDVLAANLESAFCVEALSDALRQGRPEIFNTDQGARSPARLSRGDWSGAGFGSAGTDAVAPWTMCSRSGCGEA
jgi:hypothetical protein